jgi:hypothetical protein
MTIISEEIKKRGRNKNPARSTKKGGDITTGRVAQSSLKSK